MKTQKKKYGILIMTIMILFSSCSTQRAESSESSSEPQIMRVETEYKDESDSLRSDELDVQVRNESHFESVSEAENNIESSAVQSHSNISKAMTPTLSTKIETAIATPVPTSSPSPISDLKKSESTATSKPTNIPTIAPTAIPTAAIKPTETPTPTSTPSPVPTITPKPITESKVVWTIDVPGHYESVEVTKEIWVEEQGHWESGYWTSDWVYQCNQCGAQYPTVSEVNSHLDDSFDWDTMTGHSSYTQVSGELYWVETDPMWIVDVSGHYESVTVTEEVWVEEQGHWETITTE